MATSAWFDYNGYMANKLVQVQKAEPTANWDMMKLVKAFSDAGFAGAVGAEKHFEQFGQYEDVAPNAFFNPTEYFRAKAAQFYGKDPKAVTDLDVATIQLAIKDAGMSAWSHYEQFGNTEKVNPSNSFDTEAYMNAKLTALNNVKDGKQYTLPEVYDAFKAAGLSALEHFMLYGGNGDGEVAQKYDPAKPAIPAEFAVPEEKKVNSGGSDGNFIELTEKIDNLQGTTGNDVFVGTAGTSQNMDSISGNGGEDILRLDGTTTLPGVITGVQTFSFESSPVTSNKDLSGYADLKHVITKNAQGAVEFTVAASVDMAYTGTLTGNQTVNFKGTDGKEDAATLKFNDATFTTKAVVGPKSATVQGIEKLTIEATGKNDVLTLDNTALTDLVIKGEGSFKAMGTANTALGANAAIKSIDASGLKGGAELFLTDTKFAADAAITGGVGNDTFKFDTAALGKDVVLKGGTAEGDNDTLIFGANVTIDDAAAQKIFAQFSEFETLAVTGTGVDLNVDRSLMADVKTFKVDDTGQMTITKAKDGDHFIHGGSGSSVTADTMSITMASGETGKISLELQGGVNLASNALQLKGTNTFDLISNDIAGGGANTIKITNDATVLTPNTTVNVEGDTNLEITSGAVVAGSNGLNVKASAFAGDLTVTGHSGDDVVIGGKGHNVITGGTGIDTIDLAASKGVHDAVGLTGILAAANRDIIKGFEVGAAATADTVFLNSAAALTGSAVTLNAVVEGGKLELAQTAGATTVNELSGDIGADAATGAGILKHVSATTTAESDLGHLVVYGEGKAYLYYVSEGTGTSTLLAADFHLIGTFDGIAAGGFEGGNVVW